MNKLIVLSSNVIEQLTEFYANNTRYKLTDNTIYEILKNEFILESHKIQIEKSKKSLSAISRDVRLNFTFQEGTRFLKVYQWESLDIEQYTESILNCEKLEGPFDFITEEESGSFTIEINSKYDMDRANCISETRALGKRTKRFNKVDDYQKYWEDIDLLKRYELDVYEKKLKSSFHLYNDMQIDYKRNELLLSITEIEHTFLPGDELFVCTKDSYIECNGKFPPRNRWKVGKFKSVKKDEINFVIETTPEVCNELTNSPELKQGYVFFQDIGYISKLGKENKAIHKLFYRDTANTKMQSFFPDTQYAEKKQKQVNEKLLRPSFESLDIRQKEAILGALKSEDIFLIQGPPGTGKTTVICEIISYLIKNKKKVLLSSQTNLAVDNVLQRIGEENGVRAVRIGKEEKFELGSERYALDNRVMDMQSKIIAETKEKTRKIEEIIQGKIIDPLMYSMHENVSEIMILLGQLEKEKTAYEEGIVIKENLNKTLYEKIIILQREIDDIEYLKNGKLEVIEKINAVAVKLGYTNKSLESNYDLFQVTALSNNEEKELASFEALSKKAGIVKKNENALEMEILKFQEKKIEWVKKLNMLNHEIREVYLTREPKAGDDISISLMKKQYEEDLEQFKKLEIEIENRNQQLTLIRTENSFLFEEVNRLSGRIQPIVDSRKEILKKLLNTGIMTKSRLLELFRNSREFRGQFSVSDEDFYLITKLEEFKNIKVRLDLLLHLNENIKNVNDAINQLKEQLKIIEGKIEKITQNTYYKSYMNHYNLDVQKIDSANEKLRCEIFIKEYKEIERRIHLYDNTRTVREEWINALKTPQQCFRDIYIKISNLLCATCIGIASSDEEAFLNSTFDYVIIDEAARATSAELLVPLIRGKTMVLVGDQEQINPEIERSILERMEKEENIEMKTLKEIYNHSLFGKLFESSPIEMKTFLNKQFRMHSGISKIVSKYFYSGELLDGPKVFQKRHGLRKLNGSSMIFINTPMGEKYEEKEDNTSFRNEGEAESVLSILRYLDNEFDTPKKVGIIAPYRAQITYLKTRIPENFRHLIVEVNTIDSFQGREKDIILLSLVRNNCEGKIGHLGEKSRVNVALSRAQELLVVIGHSPFFKTSKRAHQISNIINELEQGGKVYEIASFT